MTIPATTADVPIFEEMFAAAGFNGCVGSTDATNVGMLSFPHWASMNHKGPKLNIPFRTCNVAATHWRQILGATLGHPSAWNDKTVALCDKLAVGAKCGELFAKKEFTLHEHDENNNMIEVTYVGAWFIADNGRLA